MKNSVDPEMLASKYHTLCVRAVKALTRLHRGAGLSEASLTANAKPKSYVPTHILVIRTSDPV